MYLNLDIPGGLTKAWKRAAVNNKQRVTLITSPLTKLAAFDKMLACSSNDL